MSMGMASGVGFATPDAFTLQGMSAALRVSIGQCSDRGVKVVNQDFHGCLYPDDIALVSKGVAVALADGISSSEVSQIAAETAVKSFLADYYATSEAWPVKTAVQRVLAATNSWLYAQTRKGPHRFDLNRGYVCTFSAVVIKSNSAHLFHIGDARICYLSGEGLEPLTEDHRLWVTKDQSYLSRALGMRERLELDYQRYSIEEGATLVLMTDGVYEHVADATIARIIREHADNLDRAAQRIVEAALANGSDDNLTIQIVRVDQLPPPDLDDLNDRATQLPFPPALQPRSELDGYRILRELHNSPRSHVYLAEEKQDGSRVVLKTPATDQRDDAAYLERFLTEEWVARRLDNPHVVKAAGNSGQRSRLYTVFEYVDGQTLEQWMHDNPRPDLEAVRKILEQIVKGLRALHRQEMVHQDLRPANIMIDRDGNVKLIDFGSMRVAGIAEITRARPTHHILGTAQYSAPEYFLGEPGTPQSDYFSLGVIAYQMLSGRLPYGPDVAKATSRTAQNRLQYRSVCDAERTVPTWIDGCLKKAVHPRPAKRYDTLSEFLYDLRHPNPALVSAQGGPLLERNPLLFWKGLSFLLSMLVLVLLLTHPVLHS